MSIPREDLLRPSLGDPAKLAAAPYSLQTGFFAAFFGGPFAAALMLALNARRVGRLDRDWFWAVLIAAAFMAWLYVAYQTAAGQAMQTQLADWMGNRVQPLLQRLLALLAFVAGMWLHRREQRSADLFGLKRPNGWLAGIALIVAGVLLTIAATALLA